MLIRGDARAIPLRDKSVNCIVTSPPYWGLRNYENNPRQIGNERYYTEYVKAILEVGSELYRVLRDDGTFWLVIGDSYATGSGKIARVGGGPQGEMYKRYFGLRTPGSQPGMHAMTAPNRLPQPGLKPKDLCGIPWRVALGLQEAGWYLRSDCIWSKPNPMIESAKDRPTRSHEYIFLLTKSRHYWYDSEAIAEPQSESERRRRLLEQKRGLKTRYNLRRDESHGQHAPSKNGALHSCEARQKLAEKGTRNRRTVWTVPKGHSKLGHFATYPRKLIQPCILAGCPPGGIVFDPFVGTGTTIMEVQELGRIGLGMDLSYQGVAANRIGRRLFAP